VVLLYKESFTAKTLVFNGSPSTFELIGAILSADGSIAVTVVVYRPGGDDVNQLFYDELTTVLEQLASYSCPVVVTDEHSHRCAWAWRPQRETAQ